MLSPHFGPWTVDPGVGRACPKPPPADRKPPIRFPRSNLLFASLPPGAFALIPHSAFRTPGDYKKSSNKIAARPENRTSDRPYINRDCV